ncbi:MAG: RNA polymerase sigma factor [Ginsengibacter sp.]
MRHIDTNNDYHLARLVAFGNTDAFRELFDKYRNKVFSIAYKFTSTEAAAEDLTQEIFIKIWLNKEKLTAVNHFNSYLNAIVKNHVFNYLRKMAAEQKMKVKLSVVREESHREAADPVCYKELQNLVSEAVSQLPPQQKKVYQFSRHDGLKHEEIAAKMGISRSTVKGHMVEALNYIRKYLTANGEMIRIFTMLIFLPL